MSQNSEQIPEGETPDGQTPGAGVEPQPSSPQQTDATAATEQQPAGAPTGSAAQPGGQSGGQSGGQGAEKPTNQWATGDEPMTGPQASYLSTLAREAGEEVPEGLTKAQASDLIDRLQSKSSRVEG